MLLLWHLAARWGRVEPAGIRVSLPLTHRLLGQLVAAERPSISHALARLVARRPRHRLRRRLAPARHARAHLEALIERTGAAATGIPRRCKHRIAGGMADGSDA